MSSPNSSSTAIVPSRTSLTRGRSPKRKTIARRRRRHLRRPGRDAERHPPRARSRRPALVDRQPLPPRHRAGSSASSTTTSRRSGSSQREQDGSEVRSVELERLTAEGITLIERRNAMEFFRDQAAEQFERPHRLVLAPALRLDGQSSHADRGDDRQPRLPRRQAPRRDRGAAAARTEDRLHRRARLQRPSPDLGSARQGPRQASRHGAAAWRLAEGRRTDRRQMGRPTARCRRSPSSPTGPNTPRPHRSSATTQCSTVLPIGVMHFPGTGIQDNLADKAKKLGIPVWKFGGE